MSATPALIPDLLSDYGAKTRTVLNEYLPKTEPREHLYDLVADYPGRGGKMMRPSICIAAARADMPTYHERCLFEDNGRAAIRQDTVLAIFEIIKSMASRPMVASRRTPTETR